MVNKDSFNFRYSADQQREVEEIRKMIASCGGE